MISDRKVNSFFSFVVISSAFCLQAAIAQTPGKENEFKTWTSESGEFSIEASLVSFVDGSVGLRKRDGAQVDVPVDRLHLEGHKYISSRT